MGAVRTQGVALVAVLWILVLLATIAGGYAYGVRTEFSLTRNAVQTAKARSLAEAGLNRAIMELLHRRRGDPWRADGSEYQLQLGAQIVTASIQAAAGLVDLNTASPALLSQLLAAVAVSPQQRQRLVDAILDWRDEDDLHRLHGAEVRDYRASGLSYGPANRPFDYVGELSLVMGMQPAIFARLRPLLTVHSGTAGVIRELAPPAVLLALADGDQEVVATEMAARDAQSALAEIDATRGGNDSVTGTYHLTGRAELTDGGRAELRAVVAIGVVAGEPYTILDWDFGHAPQRGGDAQAR